MSFRDRMEPINIVIAVDLSGGFGKEGKIPWDFKEDMKHFQEVTEGGICIMGRKTYEDMLEMRQQKRKSNAKKIKAYEDIQEENGNTSKSFEILPGRKSIIITTKKDYNAYGATVANSLRSAIQQLEAEDTRPIFVLGGEKLFIEALPWTTTIYMTVVDGDYGCDKFFPLNALKSFRIIDGEQSNKLKFITYKRVR